MKLYEKVLKKVGWWKETVEKHDSIDSNPKIGLERPVTIDTLDYRHLNFFVKEIRENSVVMIGESEVSDAIEAKFTDYLLQAQQASESDVWVRLRSNGDTMIVLSLYDELTYNEEFQKVCKDVSGKFVVDEGEVHEEYWRVGDVKVSYTAKVRSEAVIAGTTESDIEFWDFSRTTTIETVQVVQFLFVEMNKENGWFQIWRGSEISPESVRVF